MKKNNKTLRLVFIAMFAAILCVSAYISIPLPPTGYKLTALNFVITLIALTFDWKDSFTTCLVWFALGLVGVPVFIGGEAGIGYILKPTGGFTIAFLFVALFLPLFCSKWKGRLALTLAGIGSAVFVDLFGTVYLMFGLDCSFGKAFLVGFVPFIVVDIIKTVVAAQIAPSLRKIFSQS